MLWHFSGDRLPVGCYLTAKLGKHFSYGLVVFDSFEMKRQKLYLCIGHIISYHAVNQTIFITLFLQKILNIKPKYHRTELVMCQLRGASTHS